MHIRIGSIAFAALLATQIASADGCFMPPEETYGRLYGDLGATSTEQKGIIIEPAEGREVLLLQTTYHGPASGFAWVIPVPGEPIENEVFIASAEFIDHALSVTAPVVHTHIDLPPPPESRMTEDAVMPPPEEAAAEEEVVTLHRRMDVGDYDVSVLSATGPNVLVDWLNENGYATPEEHASIFDHYVGKGWYFVALRVRPAVVEDKPVLNDVKPIGIEFWCDPLVYPLHISRASSREKTALTLVTLSREPVECEQLKRARLPLGDNGRGTSYARIRRETIERQADASAIVEYAGYQGVWQAHIPWRDGMEPDLNSADLRDLWATRLWTILDRDEMEDLSFATADVTGERVFIRRTGKLPGPPRRGGILIPALVVAGLAVMFLGVYRLAAHRVRLAMLIAVTLLLGAGGAVDDGGLITTAHAGSVSVRHSGLKELDAALALLDDAILAFLEDAGCYPASLEDMTEMMPPETGLDSSGNQVPVGGDWMGSRIKQLPTDPLTGRNDTWVYEVTGSPMIDSGGLRIEVKMRETPGRYSDG